MLKSKAPELPLAMDQISALCNLCYPAGFRYDVTGACNKV